MFWPGWFILFGEMSSRLLFMF